MVIDGASLSDGHQTWQVFAELTLIVGRRVEVGHVGRATGHVVLSTVARLP